MVGTQVPFLQTTLPSKASKLTSTKCSLPKQVSKNIFQIDGTYAFLSLIGFYFIEVKVANLLIERIKENLTQKTSKNPLKKNSNGHSINWKFNHTTHGNTLSIK